MNLTVSERRWPSSKVGVALWFSSTSQNLCRKSSLEETETWWEVTLQYERLDVLVFQARTQPNLGLKCNWGQVWEAIHLLHVELPQLWVRSFHLVKCWRYVETWRWNAEVNDELCLTFWKDLGSCRVWAKHSAQTLTATHHKENGQEFDMSWVVCLA